MSKILETETEGYGPSFAIHGFMRYLGLRPAQLVAYALIYSCTVDKGCYDFGAAVLADWSGTSERTARTTIASLLDMGLIVERGSHVHGMNTVGRSLVAAADPISRAREAWQADHPDAERVAPLVSLETISPENTSSPEISSREDSSSPAIFSGEPPYIPISNDYPEDWTDGWMDFQTNQPDVYPGMDSQVDTAGDFRKIADETINRNKLDAARQPYDELRRLGFGADEIGTAWARRQAEAKQCRLRGQIHASAAKMADRHERQGLPKDGRGRTPASGPRRKSTCAGLPTAPGSSSATGRSIRLWMRTESSIAAITRTLR